MNWLTRSLSFFIPSLSCYCHLQNLDGTKIRVSKVRFWRFDAKLLLLYTKLWIRLKMDLEKWRVKEGEFWTVLSSFTNVQLSFKLKKKKRIRQQQRTRIEKAIFVCPYFIYFANFSTSRIRETTETMGNAATSKKGDPAENGTNDFQPF